MENNPTSYIAIVGSRDVPLDYLELLIRVGRTCTDLGFSISSGDAYGSDRAGWYGAKQSAKYDSENTRIYLCESKKNRYRAIEHGFLIAHDYPECWTIAEAMALEARGSWNGLTNQYQRDLHVRNVYQVLGHTLNEPVKASIYYAPVIGNPTNEHVRGGTNSHVQIAKKANIERRINLATESGYQWVMKFLKRHESVVEYEDIDWHQILKPDDPRLQHI